jgi:hypothetical protein
MATRRCSSHGCSSRGCKLATLRRRCYSAAMAGRADELLWRAGSTATLLCSDGITEQKFLFLFFFFFLLGNFNGLFYAREEENDKLLYAQVRAREQEKNRARKRKKEKERESFETCLV